MSKFTNDNIDLIIDVNATPAEKEFHAENTPYSRNLQWVGIETFFFFGQSPERVIQVIVRRKKFCAVIFRACPDFVPVLVRKLA